jgi:hypothetical protein
MTTTLITTAIAASTGTAATYSLVWLLAGGGFMGAIVVFLIAKVIGR